MPRKYINQGKRKPLDTKKLADAIKAVTDGNMSVRKAAQAFHINYSSLQRYTANVTKEDDKSDSSKAIKNRLQQNTRASLGTKPIFNHNQEKALADYLKTCGKMNYGLSVNMTLRLVYQYAVQQKVNYPNNWNKLQKATKDWYYGFMKRNPSLSLRKPVPISLARSKGFCKQSVDEFFKNYCSVYNTAKYPPSRIWNLDETGCPTVPPKPGLVIAEKGSDVGRSAGSERGTNVTMCLAVSAAGERIPPFFIFPRQNLQSSYMRNKPFGAIGKANGSGYMDTKTFIEYFDHFIKETHASKENPLLLVMDNHSSHISVEIVRKARENGIEIVTLPPHCSHRLQPLDVGVFGPFKHYYDDKCEEWTMNNAGNPIEIDHVVELAGLALNEVHQKSIKSSFAAPGLYPLDRSKFGDSDFVAAKISGENVAAEQEELGLDEDDRRSIFFIFDEEEDPPGATEEVSTSEPSTSGVSTRQSTPGASTVPSTSDASDVASLRLQLAQMGPVQLGQRRKKSNRGPKAMTSMVLTSPEVTAKLQEKADLKAAKAEKSAATAAKRAESKAAKAEKAAAIAAKKAATAVKKAAKEMLRAEKAAAKTAKKDANPAVPKTTSKSKSKPVNKMTKKRKRKPSTSSEEDVDFCMAKGCGQLLDVPMTRFNTIECNKCKRPYHLRCVTVRSYFTCDNCDSDLVVSDE